MLEKACLVQTLSKCGHEFLAVFERSPTQNSDHRHHRLLPACRDRPRRRRAAEQRDDFAPPDHSITSSARPRSEMGTVRPSDLAVLRLMIISTFTTCWTGRSAGLSPFRIRPV